MGAGHYCVLNLCRIIYRPNAVSASHRCKSFAHNDLSLADYMLRRPVSDADCMWRHTSPVRHRAAAAAYFSRQIAVLTDIASGWTECLPLLVREQGLIYM